MHTLRSFIPSPLLRLYHFCLAYAGAIYYGFPSKKLIVIGVTGTKGKSSIVEMTSALLRDSGYKVASASTIRFTLGDTTERNLFKMTMPGRFFLQHFLYRAVAAKCTHAVIEMTSEGALQYRHKGIHLDALIFNNLQPEHLERHGSFEAYAAAKLRLAKALSHSSKRPRIIISNIDDAYGAAFLDHEVDIRAPFSLKDAEPYTTNDHEVRFIWKGTSFTAPLPGVFSLYNSLAALTCGHAFGLTNESMQHTLSTFSLIPGRAERIDAGQPFSVVVDYAHTPDSLKALYETYASPNRRIIGVLGNTGGGRDTWKRPAMAALADQYCAVSILTNEDPYDEDPRAIIADMEKGFSKHIPQIIMDRREAILAACSEAKPGDVVLITGKGTDPFIMGANGSKQEWSDAAVAREVLQKLGYN